MFHEYVEHLEKRYCCLFWKPMMVEVSMKTGIITKYVPLYHYNDLLLPFISIVLYKNKLLYVPLQANAFYIYDLENDIIRTIDIPKIGATQEKREYFGGAYQNDKYVYAFGFNYPGIVKLNIETETAECIVNLKAFGYEKNGVLNEMVCKEKILFLPLKDSNSILCIDTEKDTVELIELNIESGTWISSICSDGIDFFVITNNGNVYRYDNGFKNKRHFKEIEEMLLNKTTVIHSAFFDNSIIIFPDRGNAFFQYSLELQKGKWVEVPERADVHECF